MGILEGNGRFEIPDSQNTGIPWEFSGNLGGELEDLKSPMPGILLLYGNLGGELEDLNFLTPGKPLFYGNWGEQREHSKFLMPAMPLFHENLEGKWQD